MPYSAGHSHAPTMNPSIFVDKLQTEHIHLTDNIYIYDAYNDKLSIELNAPDRRRPTNLSSAEETGRPLFDRWCDERLLFQLFLVHLLQQFALILSELRQWTVILLVVHQHVADIFDIGIGDG